MGRAAGAGPLSAEAGELLAGGERVDLGEGVDVEGRVVVRAQGLRVHVVGGVLHLRLDRVPRPSASTAQGLRLLPNASSSNAGSSNAGSSTNATSVGVRERLDNARQRPSSVKAVRRPPRRISSTDVAARRGAGLESPPRGTRRLREAPDDERSSMPLLVEAG